MNYLHAILSVFRSKPCLLLQWLVLGMLALFSMGAQAQDKEWRFEIEVILFEHLDALDALQEEFGDASAAHSASAVDLITPYLLPDLSQVQGVLPLCHVAPEPSPEENYLDQVTSAVFSPEPQLQQEPFDFDGYQSEDMRLIQQAFAEYGFYEDVPDTQVADDPILTSQDELYSTGFGETDTPITTDNVETQASEGIAAFEMPTPPPVPEFLTHPLAPVQMPESLWCMYTEERFPLPVFAEEEASWYALDEVPAVLDGTEWPYETRPYLLSRSSLRLKKLVRDMRRQKKLRPLLHLGWRQEVQFGRSNAPFFRLFAGDNYADAFAADGSPLMPMPEPQEDQPPVPSEDDSAQDPLIERIRAALQNEQVTATSTARTFSQNADNVAENQPKASDLWQLGGLFKVYLQYINRVPYLHIDADMDYRAPVQQGEGDDAVTTLKTHNFKQLRRVISRQVHYFDHPLFGMVVQIRRYQRPTPPETDTAP